MLSVEMIVNAISVAILAGLALLPFVNVVVGTVVGGSVAGPIGFCIGALLALLITAIEVMLLQNGPRLAVPAPNPMRLVGPTALGRAIVNLADWRRSTSPIAAEPGKGRQQQAA